MVKFMKKHLLTMLSASAALFAASCTKDIVVTPDVESSGEEVNISFTIATEPTASTRAGGFVNYPSEGNLPVISDGSKAHLLVYAVYDKDGNLLEQYGNGLEDDEAGTLRGLGYTEENNVGAGQTVRYVKEFPTTVSLRLVRGKEYKVAFWAQDENCKAYVTTDLHRLEVKYGEGLAVNNDESRDAFCKTETLTAVENGNRTVILRRPLAQINVGVAGYDYEAASKGDCRVVESKIHLNRVARFLDVITNNVDITPENLQTIEFDFATIPAYINMNGQIPEEKYDYEDSAVSDGGAYYNGAGAYHKWSELGNLKHYADEVMLRVDRNNDGVIAEYKNEDDENASLKENGWNGGHSPYTEEYKYLSMCYVLVPDRAEGLSTYSTTLDNVDIYLKYRSDSSNIKEINLTQVPVQRNWRTNIIGELLTANIDFEVDLDPMYAGDYNYENGSWNTIIHEGVSYDAQADAILISNGAGLKWLSDMTNGFFEDPTKDLTESDERYAAAVRLKELILRATKVPQSNGKQEWPGNNIFHFPGVTVKLMNDVDLTMIPDYNGPWIPIALSEIQGGSGHENSTTTRVFEGIFDGGNHTISNMTTLRPEEIGKYFKENVPALKSSMGLFSTVGYGGYIKNVRLYNIDVEGHYRTGGVVGMSFYGGGVDSCYVDKGTIISTPWETNPATKTFDDANHIGGIIGQLDPGANWSDRYKDAKGGSTAISVNNNFVRNLTLRAYRSLGSIIGGTTAEGNCEVKNNIANSVMIIADQFQPYETPDEYGEYNWSSLNALRTHEIIGVRGQHRIHESNGACGTTDPEADCFAGIDYENNVVTDVTIIAFNVKDNKRTNPDYNRTDHNYDRYRYTEIANAPLNVFPRLMGIYTDYIHFMSSIVGEASAYKKYTDNNGVSEPDENSGKVGLYASNMVLDGDAEDLENVINPDHVVTAQNVSDSNDCIVYVTGSKATLKNITFRGAPYAYTGICLDPAQNATITLDKVIVYDSVYTINDEGNGNGATLKVTDSNLRGHTSYGSGYSSVTFTNTVFEQGSGTELYNEALCTTGSDTTFEGCTFRQGFKISNDKGVKLTFKNCKYGTGTSLDPEVELTAENISLLGIDSANF